MTKTTLAWDEGYDERELGCPSADDLTTQISALNGADRSLVMIYRDEAHLAVGGSASDGLVVYCTFGDEVFWQLQSMGDPMESQTVVAGGQAGSYPANLVVPLKDALAAAVEFAEHGVREPLLRWTVE